MGRHRILDCVIIGAGQSGLATGYYLAKKDVDFLILDANEAPGGAWQHAWDSLTLFSQANASNLPGWPMPHYEGFPPASHVVDYLTRYAERYQLPVEYGAMVRRVEHNGRYFTLTVETSNADTRVISAHTVVAATGTWDAPFVPFYPGTFGGKQWHTVDYPGPEAFHGSRVAVVGGGNSGAQIAAELALDPNINELTWYTARPPRWMPDDVDGRVLFQRNRARLNAMLKGEADPYPNDDLGDIVMVPPVREARDSGALDPRPMVDSLGQVEADHLIWATGFRPALKPLRHLLRREPQASSAHAYSPKVKGLFLVGYGNWTGPGSATITGVSPFAKQTAQHVADLVSE